MADPCTKFEVSSFSHCGHFSWDVKFYNGSADPDHAPFREDLFIGRVVLATISQRTKFEVSRFTRYEAVNGGEKCRKWGG